MKTSVSKYPRSWAKSYSWPLDEESAFSKLGKVAKTWDKGRTADRINVAAFSSRMTMACGDAASSIAAINSLFVIFKFRSKIIKK